MQTVLYLLFIVVGYLITYLAHIQTKREQERYLKERVSQLLRECEEVKKACRRVDKLLADY